MDPTEAMLVAGNVYVGYSTRCRGHLDTTALATAFAALRATHPVLAGHIEPHDNHYMLVVPPDTTSDAHSHIRLSRNETHESLQGTSIHIDPRRTLSALHIDQDTDGAQVTLLVNHSVADGSAGIAMLADLWDQYTTVITTGRPRPVEPNTVPMSPNALFTKYGYQGYTPPAGDTVTLPTPPSLVFSRERLLLSQEQTSALRTLATTHGVTLNGLLSGAAVRGNIRANGWDKAQNSVGFIWAINLRTRLAPEVAPTAATNPLGIGLIHLDAAEELDPIAFATLVRDQLRRGVESGDVFTPMARVFAQGSMFTSDQTMMQSNWGVVPELHTPHGLTIDDFRAMFTGADAWPTDIHIVYRFNGQLALEHMSRSHDNPTLKEPAPAQDIIAAIKEELLAL